MLAVLLFHGEVLAGGFLGVDAFFVLSGFLITSLLLVEAAGTRSLRLGRFWGRRARRLLPALVLTCFGVVLYARTVAEPEELATIRGDALATLLYVANWRQIVAGSDYWALFRAPSPLQHTWSLAIEEQFYVLWPLVVLGLVRGAETRVAARRVLLASLGLAAGSIVLAQVLFDPADPSRVYFGTDTRIASILLGAALAAWVAWRGPARSDRARLVLEVLGCVSLAGLAVAWSRIDGSSAVLYRGGLVACALATTAVIAAGSHPDRRVVARLLSFGPLCALGLISYGVYLWHWPLYAVLSPSRSGLDGWPLLGVRIGVTLVVATISYRWVEQPIRRGAGNARLWWTATPAIAGTLVAAVLLSTRGAPGAPVVAEGPVRGGAMVVGSSIGTSLVVGLQEAGVPTANRTVFGCSIVPGYVDARREKHAIPCGDFQGWIEEAAPQVVVLVLGPFETLDLRPGEGSPEITPESPEFAERFKASLQQAIDVLGSSGALVVVPSIACVDARFLDSALRQESTANPERLRLANAWLQEVVTRPANRGKVVSPDLNALLCPKGTYQQDVGEVRDARRDGVHFSREGAVAVARWLKAQVPELASVRTSGTSVADDLSSKLAAEKFECWFPPPARDKADRGSLSVLRCWGPPGTVNIQIYQDRREFEAFSRLQEEGWCAAARQAGHRSVPILAGESWLVTGDTGVLAVTARALRVPLRRRDCAPAKGRSG